MIRVALPWPGPDLSQNARIHHMRRYRATKKYRRWAAQLTSVSRGTAQPPEHGPIQVSVTFFPPDRRRYDWDGLQARLKSGFDGIADALGVDDNRFRPGMMVGDPVKHGMVEVRLSWTPAAVGAGVTNGSK